MKWHEDTENPGHLHDPSDRFHSLACNTMAPRFTNIILTAVNNHDALLAACEEMIYQYEGGPGVPPGGKTWDGIQGLKAAIAKAKG